MISPGRILYLLYYKQRNALTKLFRNGLRKSIETERGRKAMQEAAKTLQELFYPGRETFEVYFLTGKKYWFQTAFCLFTLQKQSGINIRAVIVDDGSFDEGLEKAIKSTFPSSTVIRNEKIQELLDQYLPQSTFPALRKRRVEYPHIRKLTDIHLLGGDGIKLVLDSDMLFFKKPVALLNWLRNPETLLFMRDSEESYGYTSFLMSELAGTAHLPERLNVGVAGIPSKAIDWEKLERWTNELIEKEGSSYLQEQALTAMIAATNNFCVLPESEYKVLPLITGQTVSEVLHHYVAESKYDYFVKGWKIALHANTKFLTNN